MFKTFIYYIFMWMVIRAISLISGGIDSPVSSYLMLRRGVELIYLHFHSFPLVSRSSIYKAMQLVKILSSHGPTRILYLAPLAEIQSYLRTRIDPRYLVILYRRFMLRIAERIAKREGAIFLVTGESLAQVSSQTLQNLRVIESAVRIPILRPLIGFDKEEIMSLAREIGTYDVSIKPQEDCCTLFVPRRQATAAKLEEIEAIEKFLPVEELIARALEKIEIVKVS
jgi:thiamine biosynthesis protein ThiI